MSPVSPVSSIEHATVILIDDDELLSAVLAAVLVSVQIRVRSFTSAQAYLNEYDASAAGCIISDIRMPGMDGLSLQKNLKALRAINPLIFITSHADVSMAVHAMQQGAFDFLEKPVDHPRLINAVQRALTSDRDHRDGLARLGEIRRRFDALTRREQEVLDLMADGKPNKLIAAQLNIAERTVEYHRASLMEKTKASSLAHLLRMKIALEQ
jgi:two-component system response regulator FixJ